MSSQRRAAIVSPPTPPPTQSVTGPLHDLHGQWLPSSPTSGLVGATRCLVARHQNHLIIVASPPRVVFIDLLHPVSTQAEAALPRTMSTSASSWESSLAATPAPLSRLRSPPLRMPTQPLAAACCRTRPPSVPPLPLAASRRSLATAPAPRGGRCSACLLQPLAATQCRTTLCAKEKRKNKREEKREEKRCKPTFLFILLTCGPDC